MATQQNTDLDFKKKSRLLNVLLQAANETTLSSILTNESQIGYDITNKRIKYKTNTIIQYLLNNSDISTDETLGGTEASDLVLSSQKATKTYIDNILTSGIRIRGSFEIVRVPDIGGGFINGEAEYPKGDASLSIGGIQVGNGSAPELTIKEGDAWYISNAGGTMGGKLVNVGDLVIALVNNANNNDNEWLILESNISNATETTVGKTRIATSQEVLDREEQFAYVTPHTLDILLQNLFLIEKTYDELSVLKQDGLLKKGQFYKVTDRGDVGLIVQATSVNEISSDAIYIAATPKYESIVPYYSKYYTDIYDLESNPVGLRVICGGYVWEVNESGTIKNFPGSNCLYPNIAIPIVPGNSVWSLVKYTDDTAYNYELQICKINFDWLSESNVVSLPDGHNSNASTLYYNELSIVTNEITLDDPNSGNYFDYTGYLSREDKYNNYHSGIYKRHFQWGNPNVHSNRIETSVKFNVFGQYELPNILFLNKAVSFNNVFVNPQIEVSHNKIFDFAGIDLFIDNYTTGFIGELFDYVGKISNNVLNDLSSIIHSQLVNLGTSDDDTYKNIGNAVILQNNKLLGYGYIYNNLGTVCIYGCTINNSGIYENYFPLNRLSLQIIGQYFYESQFLNDTYVGYNFLLDYQFFFYGSIIKNYTYIENINHKNYYDNLDLVDETINLSFNTCIIDECNFNTISGLDDSELNFYSTKFLGTTISNKQFEQNWYLQYCEIDGLSWTENLNINYNVDFSYKIYKPDYSTFDINFNESWFSIDTLTIPAAYKFIGILNYQGTSITINHIVQNTDLATRTFIKKNSSPHNFTLNYTPITTAITNDIVLNVTDITLTEINEYIELKIINNINYLKEYKTYI